MDMILLVALWIAKIIYTKPQNMEDDTFLLSTQNTDTQTDKYSSYLNVVSQQHAKSTHHSIIFFVLLILYQNHFFFIFNGF